jgi:hypothetical protein
VLHVFCDENGEIIPFAGFGGKDFKTCKCAVFNLGKKWRVPGSNWGPLVCETSVITTTPTHRIGSEIKVKLSKVPFLPGLCLPLQMPQPGSSLCSSMSLVVAQLKQHVKPLPIDSWLKLLGTTQGRDKIYRFIQYFGRFLAFYLSQLSPEADYVKRIQRLSLGVGLARKRKQRISFWCARVHGMCVCLVFRVGKPLDNLQVILKSSAIADELERSLTVSKALGFGGWLALDMFQWVRME